MSTIFSSPIATSTRALAAAAHAWRGARREVRWSPAVAVHSGWADGELKHPSSAWEYSAAVVGNQSRRATLHVPGGCGGGLHQVMMCVGEAGGNDAAVRIECFGSTLTR